MIWWKDFCEHSWFDLFDSCWYLLLFASLRVKQIDFFRQFWNHQPWWFFWEPGFFTILLLLFHGSCFHGKDFYDSMRAGKVFQPSDLKQIEAITPGQLVWFVSKNFGGRNTFALFGFFSGLPLASLKRLWTVFFVWQYEYMNMLKEHGWRKHRMWKACEKNIMDKRRHNYFKGQNWEHLKDLKHIRTNKRLYCWVRIRQSRQDSPWMNSPTLWTLEKKQFEDFDLEQIWTW